MNFASLRDRIRWFQQPDALRAPLVGVVDSVQHLPGHFQILAIGLTFNVLCKAVGIKPQEILDQLNRMEGEVGGPFSNQVRAMTEYARGELNA